MTRRARRGRTVARRVALVATSSVLALIGAELACRLLDLPNESVDRFAFLGPELGKVGLYVPDPTLFWRLDPDNTEYRTNALGLRGRWVASEKGDREFRIVAVGDSCTFGAGVRYEEAWAMQLERLVQRDMPGRSVQAVIAALPGWSTFQNRALLERELPSLAPDLTVFYCGVWNDYIAAIEAPDHERAARLRGEARGLRLARILGRTIRGSRDDYEASFVAGSPTDGRRVPLDHFRENLAHMFELATARDGARAVAIVPVLPGHMHERFPIASAYHEAVIETAAARGVPVVDPRAAFDAFHAGCPSDFRNPLGQPWCFVDAIHPSKIGHRLIAEAVHAGLGLTADAPAARHRSELAVSPPRVPAGGQALVSVRPTGSERFAGTPGRVFVGTRLVDGADLDPSGNLALSVPVDCVPGTHAVEVVDARGAWQRGTVTVDAMPLDARIESTESGRSRFRFRLEGPPGWDVVVWFGESERVPPASTDYGPFALTVSTGPDGRPAGRDDLPFLFERLKSPHFVGKTDDAGVAAIITAEFPTPEPGQATWVQAIARDPKSGAGLTSVTRKLVTE